MVLFRAKTFATKFIVNAQLMIPLPVTEKAPEKNQSSKSIGDKAQNMITPIDL